MSNRELEDSASDLSSTSEEGWDDIEQDEEQDVFLCFWADETLNTIQDLLAHLKESHGFDLQGYVASKDLDFYGSVKLINFLRLHAKEFGGSNPESWDFADEKYLHPVIEDDTIITNLDDIVGFSSREDSSKPASTEKDYESLRRDFEEYKALVQKTLAQKLDTVDEADNGKPKTDSNDENYFVSYSYNEIHETMLKDAIRTDSYRDFIYGNKHLFSNKKVLDVGCGTGILSMFSARAGAAQVFAVDNSAILNKAREIIFANKLDKSISCVKGKIEEVILPGPAEQKVDIIVSEWMGYTLLYEAMLSSVIVARDKYLAPGGLMVPSHCTILLAPVSDEDLVLDTYSFWNDVYGFDMSAMKEKIFEDVLIRHLPSSSLAGEAQRVCTLDINTVKESDLSFVADFSITLKEDIDTLDGFVIYFDTFFLQSRTDSLPGDARAEKWPKDAGSIAFSTGPGPRERETHWRQGLCLIEPDDKGNKLAAGTGRDVKGTLRYEMNKLRTREVDIEIEWSLSGVSRKQKWKLS